MLFILNLGAQMDPFIQINMMVKIVFVSLEIHLFDWMRHNILENKRIGDAGSTADLRMLWSAIVCLGLL